MKYPEEKTFNPKFTGQIHFYKVKNKTMGYWTSALEQLGPA